MAEYTNDLRDLVRAVEKIKDRLPEHDSFTREERLASMIMASLMTQCSLSTTDYGPYAQHAMNAARALIKILDQR